MTKHKLLITKRALWLSALALLSLSLLVCNANYAWAMAFAAVATGLCVTVFVVQRVEIKQNQANHFFVSENLLDELDHLTANGKEVHHAQEN